jgi:DNA-binding IclR family transcriptional regulator
MAVLEAEGFVSQQPHGRYMPGWKLFELGMTMSGLGGNQQMILENLQSASIRSGETAHLAILSEGHVIIFEKAESEWPLRMPSAVGKSIPARASALGKILLVGKNEAEIS